MKRLVLLFVSFCCLFSWGAEHVCLKIKIHKPETTGNGIKRSPVYAPYIFIDGHTISVDGYMSACTLQLKNGEGVAYEMSVPAGTQEIYLPEDLAGSYELLLIFGEYSFVGEITL